MDDFWAAVAYWDRVAKCALLGAWKTVSEHTGAAILFGVVVWLFALVIMVAFDQPGAHAVIESAIVTVSATALAAGVWVVVLMLGVPAALDRAVRADNLRLAEKARAKFSVDRNHPSCEMEENGLVFYRFRIANESTIEPLRGVVVRLEGVEPPSLAFAGRLPLFLAPKDDPEQRALTINAGDFRLIDLVIHDPTRIGEGAGLFLVCHNVRTAQHEISEETRRYRVTVTTENAGSVEKIFLVSVDECRKASVAIV